MLTLPGNARLFSCEYPINMRKSFEGLSALNASHDKITELEGQLAWFKRQIFGKRSERIVSNLNPQQLVFEGFETSATQEEEKKTISEHTRKKPDRNGKDKITLPDDLPVKTMILDIPEEQKTWDIITKSSMNFSPMSG